VPANAGAAHVTFLPGGIDQGRARGAVFLTLLGELGMREDQAVYLDDTGHMSGVDPLLGLDHAVREGRVRDGDNVLLLSAGTGYTSAATLVRWGGA
jgi:3-oxoacyl-[acyl-carrier-protein] synthase-3